MRANDANDANMFSVMRKICMLSDVLPSKLIACPGSTFLIFDVVKVAPYPFLSLLGAPLQRPQAPTQRQSDL